VSGDKAVEFQFRHNVLGRSTYAEGTVDAVVFLASRAGGFVTGHNLVVDGGTLVSDGS
jgi:NAD(P)-dependent dehydrogenase (short-subunit alcohol dehydrogenase family)